MFKKALIAVLLVLSATFVYAQEEKLTITTYYPSPYGSYHELRTDRLAVGASYNNAGIHPWNEDGSCLSGEICDANFVTEGKTGINTIKPVSTLHVQGDFLLNNDADGEGARIRMQEDYFPSPADADALVIEKVDDDPTDIDTGIALGFAWSNGINTEQYGGNGRVNPDWAPITNHKPAMIIRPVNVGTGTYYNVGIGTDKATIPGSTLTVQGANKVSTQSALNITDSDKNSLLFVRNDGKIGIGTNNPRVKLEVARGNILAPRLDIGNATDYNDQTRVGSIWGSIPGYSVMTRKELVIALGSNRDGTPPGQPLPTDPIQNTDGIWIGPDSNVGGTGSIELDSNVIFIDHANIGVGLEDPNFKLHFRAGAYCDGRTWTNASSKSFKKDIARLSTSDYRKSLDILNKIGVSYFRFKDDNENKLHMGLIAEEAPDIIVDKERKGLYTSDAIGLLVAAVKAQQDEISELKNRIKKLETR